MKDLFTDDYVFTGKHASMIKQLTDFVDQKTGAKIFDSAIDLYIVSGLIGVLYDKCSDKDRGQDNFRIFAAAFNNNRKKLLNVYKLVLLCGKATEMSPEDRITRAYRSYKKDENLDFFNSFVRGGIEELHDIFFGGTNVRYDDYKNEMVKLIAEYSASNDEEEENDDIFGGDVF